MTAHKHLKQLVRARMEKTGERYAAARRQILGSAAQPTTPGPDRLHYPGNIPATAALRGLLARAGWRIAFNGAPPSEAMLFGLAGGIGIGVASFFYEKEGVASFFLAGRHRWHDDYRYMQGLLTRLGVEPVVTESGGRAAAARQLASALTSAGPCVAWVDAASLPSRAMPPSWSGSAYHVVTVYAIDEAAGTATIGDLSDEPIEISLEALARARARIKRQQHRLLTLPVDWSAPTTGRAELVGLIRAGLTACIEELNHPTLPSPAMARLDALQVWSDRLDGTSTKERWERVYASGPNLLRALQSIHEFIEYYGTGGGLCRPLFADFLREAAQAVDHPPLAVLADRYGALGQAWSDLANAALPDTVALLSEVKTLLATKAAALHAGDAAAVGAAWRRLGEIEALVAQVPPLTPAAAAELRGDLKRRVLAIYTDETAAQRELLAALPT